MTEHPREPAHEAVLMVCLGAAIDNGESPFYGWTVGALREFVYKVVAAVRAADTTETDAD